MSILNQVWIPTREIEESRPYGKPDGSQKYLGHPL